jgi:hypothetical protein
MDYTTVRDLGDAGNSIDDHEQASFLSIFMFMDEYYSIYNRSAFTFIEAVSMTGGIMSIIFLVAKGVISRFQKVIYFSTLIKNTFLYQPEDISKTKHDKDLTSDTQFEILNNSSIGATIKNSILNQISFRRKFHYKI